MATMPVLPASLFGFCCAAAAAVASCRCSALRVPSPAAAAFAAARSRPHRQRRIICRASDAESLWPADRTSEADGALGGSDDESDGDERRRSEVFDSVIKVYCTHSEPDYLMPWQRVHQSTSTSSGFVVDVPAPVASAAADGGQGGGGWGPRIITNAHAVEYGSIVQVQRRGDDRKHEATVEAVGNECDLAVLRVDSPDFWSEPGGGDGSKGSGEEGVGGGPASLGFGPLPALQDEVEVLGYPTGGDSMSVTSGVVSRVEVQEYAQAGERLLVMQIDAAINEGNSGGPVVNDELEVVGVAFQALDSAENIGYVVPVGVVLHFLEDLRRHGGRYTGFCSLGVGLSALENRAFRASLGMTGGQSGVMVRDVRPTSAARGLLLPSDVIMAVDGISVANDGKIPFRRGERASLVGYVQTKFVGDALRLTLLRGGSEMTLDVPVSISPRLVPAHWNNRPPPFLIVAGLVFTALSVPFLESLDAWDDYVSDEVTHLLGRVKDPLKERTDQVVVLAQVLAHRANLGYDHFEDLHLLRYNGHAVRSLRHLEQLIYHGDDPSTRQEEAFMRFEFAPDGHIVVMERSILERVTREVCEEHSIQQPSIMSDHLGDEDKKVATPHHKISINGSKDRQSLPK